MNPGEKRGAVTRRRTRTTAMGDRVISSQRADVTSPEVTQTVTRRRPMELACAWCDGVITVKPAGRIPTWCSAGCRHRAWEQNRAALSGRSAVTVVERVVEIERPVAAPATGQAPRGAGWVSLVEALTKQLDTGRLYDRDLAVLAAAVTELNVALNRRLTRSRRW
jgi:hypothetical protein